MVLDVRFHFGVKTRPKAEKMLDSCISLMNLPVVDATIDRFDESRGNWIALSSLSLPQSAPLALWHTLEALQPLVRDVRLSGPTTYPDGNTTISGYSAADSIRKPGLVFIEYTLSVPSPDK